MSTDSVNSGTVEVCGRVGVSTKVGDWGVGVSSTVGGGGESSTFVVLRKDASTVHLHTAQYSIVCLCL